MKRHAQKQHKEIALLAKLKGEDIDTSDIPEVKDWNGAIMGKFYRPIKKPVVPQPSSRK